MPNASVDTSITERHELETLEEGFVELRRMTYGEFLKRRDMISKMTMKGDASDNEAVMQLAQEVVTRYEFSTCIIDHNLEYADGKKMDFRTQRAFDSLHPKIGQEIESLIDNMNKWEEQASEDGQGPLTNSETESEQPF